MTATDEVQRTNDLAGDELVRAFRARVDELWAEYHAELSQRGIAGPSLEHTRKREQATKLMAAIGLLETAIGAVTDACRALDEVGDE